MEAQLRRDMVDGDLAALDQVELLRLTTWQEDPA